MKMAKLKDEEMRAEYRREDLGLLVRGKGLLTNNLFN